MLCIYSKLFIAENLYHLIKLKLDCVTDTEEASETDIPHNDEPLEIKEQLVFLNIRKTETQNYLS